MSSTLDSPSNTLLYSIKTLDFSQFTDSFYHELVSSLESSILDIHPQTAIKALNIIPCFISRLKQTSNSIPDQFKLVFYSLLPLLLEKLSDSHETIRQASSIALVSFYEELLELFITHGSDKFNNYGKLISFFDDNIVQNLNSKNYKSREMIVLWIKNCVRKIPSFPINDHLTLLIHAVEDANQAVRTMAKDTIIFIYEIEESGRAMIKKNVMESGIRSSISESLLSQFQDIDTKNKKQNPAPIETMERAMSPKQLDSEIEKITTLFKGKETEDNWIQRENSLKWIQSYFFSQNDKIDVFAQHAKVLTDPIISAMGSLRTSLVLTSLSVVSDLIKKIDTHTLDALTEILFTGVSKLTTQTKKLICMEASVIVLALIQRTTHGNRFFPQVMSGLNDKNSNMRETSAKILKILLQIMKSKKSRRDNFEKVANYDVLEKSLIKGLGDSSGEVRSISRDAFHLYEDIWASRSKRFYNELDLSIKKAISRHPKLDNSPLNHSEDSISPRPRCVSREKEGLSFFKLESSDVDTNIKGIYDAAIFLDKESKDGHLKIIESDFIKLQHIIMKFMDSEDTAYLKALFESQLLMLSMDNNIVASEMIIPILLQVSCSSPDELIIQEANAILDRIESKLTFEKFFELLISSIQHSGPKTKSKLLLRKKDNLRNECVLESMLKIISKSEKSIETYFNDYTKYRICMAKIIPLLSLKQSSDLAEQLIRELLNVLKNCNQDFFSRSLSTFDVDVVSRVSELIGLSFQDEDSISEFNNEEDLHDNTFAADAESESRDEVFDETLPIGFADNTMLLHEDSVSHHHEDLDLIAAPTESPEKTPRKYSMNASIPDISGLLSSENAVSKIDLNASNCGFLEIHERKKNGLFKLFKNETPVANRKNNISTENEMEFLLNELVTKNATSSTIRRLFRISKENISPHRSTFWDSWFEPCLDALLSTISDSKENLSIRENCIILVKSMLLHESLYFIGYEKRVFELLLNCRAHGTNMISGSAEDALDTMLLNLNKENMMNAFLQILHKCSVENQETESHFNQESDSPDNSYKPLPLASAYQFLAKLILSMPKSYFSPFSSKCIDQSIKGLNCDLPEIRKGAVDCLVNIFGVIGSDLWKMIDKRVSEPQRKLLDVYIQRSIK